MPEVRPAAALIGLRVVAVKGFVDNRRRKHAKKVSVILFDDGETYIELSDQDHYTYHDFSTHAKHLEVCRDRLVWKEAMETDDFKDVGPKVELGDS